MVTPRWKTPLYGKLRTRNSACIRTGLGRNRLGSTVTEYNIILSMETAPSAWACAYAYAISLRYVRVAYITVRFYLRRKFWRAGHGEGHGYKYSASLSQHRADRSFDVVSSKPGSLRACSLRHQQDSEEVSVNARDSCTCRSMFSVG